MELGCSKPETLFSLALLFAYFPQRMGFEYVSPAPRKLKEDDHKFKASLGYIARPKKETNNNKANTKVNHTQ